MRRVACLLLIAALGAAPAHAVQPDEMLADPVLEERAREISRDLRCVVCRNESIDDSNATIAGDMRLLVRERLLEGDTDEEVRAFLVARYGEYVLLTPRATGANLILWIAGPLLLLIGGAIALRRTRMRRAPVAPLTLEEQARVEELTRR
ncbi:MAG: cytochrome c-type biogenesis protein [Pseudomonadota bacterium]